MKTVTYYQTILNALRDEIGACREWPHGTFERCGKPAEFVLWGKLIDAEGLGPRCGDCAAKHVGWRMLRDESAAIIDLRRLARAIEEA